MNNESTTNGTQYEDRLVLDPTGKNLFLHLYTLNPNFDASILWTPDRQDSRSIQRTGPYSTYEQTREAIIALIVQKNHGGKIPAMNGNESAFLANFEQLNEDEIQMRMSRQNEELSLEDLLALCRGKLSLDDILAKNLADTEFTI